MFRSLIGAALMSMLLPGSVAAQETTAPPVPEPGPLVSLTSAAPPDTASLDDRAATAAQPTGRRKRRPSMVGYIEDATLRSQIRVRFDAGWGNDRPDRAEFFYAKCGCYVFDPAPFTDPDSPGPGPGVPTELNFQQFYVLGEFAAGSRVSLFAELPFRGIQPQGFLDFGPPYDPFGDQSGLGDIRAGAKLSLLSDDMRDVTLQVRAGLPSGDAAKGLSSDLFSLEPALLFSHNVNDRFGIEGQFGAWLPFGGSRGADTDDEDFSGTVLFYGIGPSFDLVATDRARFSPVVELVGWRVIGGFQTGCDPVTLTCAFDTDENIVNLKVGARTTVDERHSFYVGYGFPLTSAEWYDKILRFEYRLGF
jgi:hypothetical protein